MIYISAIIENTKGKILLCKTKDEKGNEIWIFPGTYAANEEIARCSLIDYCRKRLYIKIETDRFFLRDIWPDNFIRIGINCSITDGNVQKGAFDGVKWFTVCEMKELNIWEFDKVVFDKVATCEYCKYRFMNQEAIEEFDKNFIDKLDEVRQLCEVIDENEVNATVVNIVYKSYLSHLRAMYIENDRQDLKKNITLQNYLKINKYTDISDFIDEIFDVEVAEGIKFRTVIRESVDKYIAHYDKPNDKSREFYVLCEDLIGPKGKIPLLQFMKKILSCTITCFMIIGYVSGEFVPTMDYVNQNKEKELKDLLREQVLEIEKKISMSKQ